MQIPMKAPYETQMMPGSFQRLKVSSCFYSCQGEFIMYVLLFYNTEWYVVIKKDSRKYFIPQKHSQ